MGKQKVQMKLDFPSLYDGIYVRDDKGTDETRLP